MLADILPPEGMSERFAIYPECALYDIKTDIIGVSPSVAALTEDKGFYENQTYN
jgi:hypothetical protein